MLHLYVINFKSMPTTLNIKVRKGCLLEYISRVDDETVISEFEKVAEKRNVILLPLTRKPFSINNYISDIQKSLQDAQNGEAIDKNKACRRMIKITICYLLNGAQWLFDYNVNLY